jgi:hypothetical protein
VGDDHRCPGIRSGAFAARRWSRRRGGWSARRAAACRAGAAAACRAPRGASRRPTGCPASRRRRAAQRLHRHSTWLSRSQRFCAVDLSWSSRHLVGGLVGIVHHQLVVAVEDRLLFGFTPSMTLLAHVQALVELRLLRQVAERRAFGQPGLAGELLVEPAMIRSSVDLPAPLTPTTPIFTPGYPDRRASDTGRACSRAARLASGAARHDRGAFRRIVRSAACGPRACQPRGAEAARPRPGLVAGQPRQPAEGQGSRTAGAKRMAAARALVHHPRIVVTDIEAQARHAVYRRNDRGAACRLYPGVGSSGSWGPTTWRSSTAGSIGTGSCAPCRSACWRVRGSGSRPGPRRRRRSTGSRACRRRERGRCHMRRRRPGSFLNVPMVDVSSSRDPRARGVVVRRPPVLVNCGRRG